MKRLYGLIILIFALCSNKCLGQDAVYVFKEPTSGLFMSLTTSGNTDASFQKTPTYFVLNPSGTGYIFKEEGAERYVGRSTDFGNNWSVSNKVQSVWTIEAPDANGLQLILREDETGDSRALGSDMDPINEGTGIYTNVANSSVKPWLKYLVVSYGDWKFACKENGDAIELYEVLEEGANTLDLTQENSLGKSVVGLKDALFSSTSVKNITLPATLTTLDGNPFAAADSLESIEVEDGSANFSSVDGNLWDKSRTQLLAYPLGKLFKRTFCLKNKATGNFITGDLKADSEGEFLAEGTDRGIVTQAEQTPAALFRFVRYNGTVKLKHLNSTAWMGGKSGSGGDGQQIDAVGKAYQEYAGAYSVDFKTTFDATLAADVELATSNFYLTDADNKLKLAATPSGSTQWSLQEVTQMPLTIGSARWASLCFPVNVSIPTEMNDLKVYKGISADAYEVKLEEVSGIIPAGQGVLVYYPFPKNINFPVVYNDSTIDNNILTGVLLRRTGLTKETFYGLSDKSPDLGVGFYLSETTEVPANKVYYKPAVANPSTALRFNFGETTHISVAPSVQQNAETYYYNMSGQRIVAPTRGLYINSKGEKVFLLKP